MKLSNEQIKFITDNGWAILASSAGDGQPRAAIVVPSRIEKDRIILSDCQMGVSNKNVMANPKVFISSYDANMDNALKIAGTAEYVTNGKLFDEIYEYEKAKNTPYIPKAIIVVKIDGKEEVHDVD
ncbi:MAG: pyridoxamine 5'-phosphate oxidase family protein [Rickettsiales bacterium]|jgi:predicted pyridoxine 5'-phosphate oxidase superfamily flavin-nucleotide-binding protein|nr:pyridoxamine 5'-phosphate oxidase family protein [Rickettsiales bacterium]